MIQIEPKNLFRYTLTDRLGVLVVQPLGESDFSIEWSRDNDNGKRKYSKEFGGNIVFSGDAYTRLLKMETSTYRCEYQNVNIERSCVSGGVRTWTQWFAGQISLNEGDWDLDGCVVSLKFEEEKPEQCFEDNKNEKINLFSETFARRTVNMFPGNVTIETKTCSDVHGGTSGDSGYYWCDTGQPYDFGWVAYRHSEDRNGGDFYTRVTDWARQVMDLECGATAPPDWILINDGCPGGFKTYAKPVNLFDCRYTYGDNYDPTYYSYTMQCQIFGQSSSGTTFDNGIPLENVINAFVQKYCPQLTVKSNFFQINPDTETTINYVTGQSSKVRFLTVYQKSDVKRPNATGNANKMEWTFEKLMATLNIMFNIQWRIEAGFFVIEHVSFFPKGTGLNLMLPRYARNISGKRKYSYKNDAIPKQEVWTWKEQNYYGDFPGLPIVYENGCVTSGSKNSIKTYAIEDVMTDVEFAISNPTPDSTRVSDDGLVFIAAERSGSAGSYVYSIITEAGILEGSRINNSLGFAQLMRDYHRHERPLKVGRLNNVITEFLSVIPTKKGETISIPFCCGDLFNPDDLITTPLGQGVVDKATFNFKGQTLDLDLLYEANANLVENNNPVAINETTFTYINQPIITDVLANDTDADPDATVTALEIMVAPAHGTAVVQLDRKVKYTPTAGYVGDDYYVYRYKDNWGQPSNNALVSITVRPANTAPVANPDSYSVFSGNVLNVSAPGVFGNDSDDFGFTLDAYDAVSVHGGSIVMQPDGSFAYTHPVGWLGADTFTYRIKDSEGNTSTATVTITTRNINAPIANPDSYQTKKDVPINAHGVAPYFKVVVNDTTPAGGSPTYTVTPEVKNSANGGIVELFSDGQFYYEPPAGFVGKDTFTYTVSNGSGTDVGTVTVNVIPDVYVRMVASDYHNVNTPSMDCPGEGAAYFDQRSTQDYTLYFFSDSAGTIPMDITAYEMSVNIREGIRNTPGGTVYNYDYAYPTTGSVDNFYNDFVTLENVYECATNWFYSERTIELLPGDYTII